MDDFERGLLLGLLIGEGHFGGDGRQPQVVLRLHTRHEALLRWVDRVLPGGRIYGPYHHDGRDYLQWMARGAFLREEVVPLLEAGLSPQLDGHTWERFRRMRRTYRRQLGPVPGEDGDGGAEQEPAAAESPPGEPPPAPGRAAELFERLRREHAGTHWSPAEPPRGSRWGRNSPETGPVSLDPDFTDGEDEGS